MNKKKSDQGLLLNCPLFGVCSGCTLSDHLEFPPVLEEAHAFFKERGIEAFPIYIGSVAGWRCQAKLAVRGTSQKPTIGLFREGTHQVVDIPACVVHHPLINAAAARVKEFMRRECWDPYEEHTHQGLVRYIQMAVERESGRVQLTLVLNVDELTEKQHKAIAALWQQDAQFWHSIWVNYNTTPTNVIFGAQWQLLHGEMFLWETLYRAKVCFLPSSFSQANREAFEALLKDLCEQLPANSKVAEFYAGSGAIGLNLASKAERVVCCEVIPQAEICFNESRKQLGGAAPRISFVVGKAEEQKSLLNDADVVVVDPPRKGIDAPLLEAIQDSKSKMLIVVSCGWKGFQRDCDRLLEYGWSLTWTKIYIFFPGSNHIEIMAIFKRN